MSSTREEFTAWLRIILVFAALIATSYCPVQTNTAFDIQKCNTIKRSAAITTSAFTIPYNACSIVKNHIENPLSYPGCVAISMAVGSITGATYTYKTYDQVAWTWFWERIGLEWFNIGDIKGIEWEDL